MATKRTYQPSKVKRARTHGVLVRMKSRGGRAVIAARRAKGRQRLGICRDCSPLTRARWWFEIAAVGFKVATGVKRYGFASSRRLKTPAEFSALLRAPRDRSIRAERQMLSINAAWARTPS